MDLSSISSSRGVLRNALYKSTIIIIIIILSQCMRFIDRHTDGQTDGQTDRILIAGPRVHSMQRGKNLVC